MANPPKSGVGVLCRFRPVGRSSTPYRRAMIRTRLVTAIDSAAAPIKVRKKVIETSTKVAFAARLPNFERKTATGDDVYMEYKSLSKILPSGPLLSRSGCKRLRTPRCGHRHASSPFGVFAWNGDPNGPGRQILDRL